MVLPTALFDYELPPQAVAQHPAQKRDHSKLMVVRRDTRVVEHRHFYELPEILTQKEIFFRNNAKVIKARMFVTRETGGEVELLLLRPSTEAMKWWCLCKPLKKIGVGDFLFVEKLPIARLMEKSPTGEALFEFNEDPLKLSERMGHLPLPPYITHADGKEDAERYQTVYAKEPVAAAAPTAGLHFTPELIEKLENAGQRFVDVTLHVGLDTFRPIMTETVEEHVIHTETYDVSPEAAEVLRHTPPGVKRVAVGTTSLRTMEDYVRKGCPSQLRQSANLFVYPPQTITAAEALITNFHLPQSTLMCLVSAFLTPGSTEGIEWIKALYREALERGYRFYSYGDAMVIL